MSHWGLLEVNMGHGRDKEAVGMGRLGRGARSGHSIWDPRRLAIHLEQVAQEEKSLVLRSGPEEGSGSSVTEQEPLAR